MSISLIIRRGGNETTHTIAGEGDIDTADEARAALAAAGDHASNSEYKVGNTTYSYAQITGTVCLGRMPRRTTFASQDNWVLDNPGQCSADSTTVSTETRAVAAGQGIDIAAPSGGWPAGARVFINGTENTALAPSGNNALHIPASALRPGDNTIEVKVGERVILRWTLRVPETPTPAQPDTPVTVGDFQFTLVNASVSPGQQATIARIVPQIDLPATTQMSIRGGNPAVTVRTGNIPAAVTRGNPIEVTLTGDEIQRMVPPGATLPTQIPVTIQIGNAAFSAQITLRAPVAALSAASVTSTASYYFNDQISVRVTSDRATRARITVGTYTQDVDLTAGVNNFNMTGAPKTWNTGAGAGTRQTFTIQIQPLDGTNLAGTAVSVGSVSIKRQGGGGGRRPPTRPSVPPLR